MSRLVRTLGWFAALLGYAEVSAAQSRLSVAAVRRDTVAAGEGGTVTAVFSVRNSSADSVVAEPVLTLPAGWTALLGASGSHNAAPGVDTWLVGVAAPTTATAGLYVIRAGLRDAAATAFDSVVVRIAERRALELTQGDAPSFVGAGDAYDAIFLLRNRGNVPATVELRLTSSAGSRTTLQTHRLTLDPGERTSVVARVIARLDGRRAREDVLELSANQASDSASAIASSGVLVVPRASTRAATITTVPAQLALRAAGEGAGVSPIALWGSGPIRPGSSATVDFAFRAAAGAQSIFGERDEYRVDFSSDRYALRLGDGSHGFSYLTSSGFAGFGAEMRRNADWNTGMYVSKDRWSPLGQTESAFLVGRDSKNKKSTGSAVFVSRSGGARVGALTGRLRLRPLSTLEFEAAATDSGNARGFAQRVQLNGEYPRVSYDVGVVRATPDFRGPSRGNTNAHASLSARPNGPISYALNTNSYATRPPPGSMFGISQRMMTSTLEATYDDATSLIYERTTRRESGSSDLLPALQQALRLRATRRVGGVDLRGNIARQLVTYGGGARETFGSFGLEARADVRADESVSFYFDRSSASVLTAMIPGNLLFGTSAQVNLPRGVRMNVNGSIMVPSNAQSVRVAQMDLTLTKPLANGMALMVRNHTTAYNHGIKMPGMNGVYLELRAPLRVPTMRQRTPGRVEGRVADAATGRGLSNILVHVGGEAVISDAHGRIAVSGLEPGNYGVTVETPDRASTGVLVGDANVTVAPGSRQPAMFSVALAQGARIRASIRQSEFFHKAAATTERDSLVDAGALENAMIVLQGARDTIYQTSDADGRVDFGVVAPGAWSMRVVTADLPAHSLIDAERRELVLQPGEKKDVEFRVIPKRRRVKMIGPETPEVIRAAPAPRNEPKPTGSEVSPLAAR